jgi:hypothetical protein
MTSRDREYLLLPAQRDLRLDFFRGIGQRRVFLDHIPFDVVNWLTFRNCDFSDAAELFVFISGYTAGFVYGPAMREGRIFAATARLLKRVWQLYVAHVFLSCFSSPKSLRRPNIMTTRCSRMNSIYLISCVIPTSCFCRA